MGDQDKSLIKEDEINFVELAKLFWEKRRFILKVAGFFFVFGLLIAISSKEEYNAYSMLLPESQESNQGLAGLSGLAGLAGFDLSGVSSSDVLPPEFYPEIVNSTPFIDNLIHKPVYFEKLDTTISSFNYIKEFEGSSISSFIVEYTLGLPRKIINSVKGERESEIKDQVKHAIVRYSKEDWNILKNFKERLSISMDQRTGIISVSVEMPDPVAAAEVTDFLIKELTEKIIDYKVGKTRVNLDFIQERFDDAKTRYESKQSEVAKSADQNRNISNSLANTEYERLQNELDIAFEVYKGLATQLEQVKIKINEETPVFTYLEPVRIPEEKSKPRRMLLVLMITVLGGIAGIGLIFVKHTFSFFKDKI